jgi:ribulose-5-phosphate 4-epimerase/fuculose-1-phosphate aldolase
MGDIMEGYRGIVGFECRLETPDDVDTNFAEYIHKNGLYEGFRKAAETVNGFGWAPKNAGNLSIRLTEHHSDFLVTASGSNFSDLAPEDIVAVVGIYMGIGDETVYIGANAGYDGDLSIATVSLALERQGLLQKALDEMGITEENLGRELTLRKMLQYLRENGMIRCRVEALGFREPSSETLLHGLIYSRRWEGPHNVNAIVHCHEPDTVDHPSVTIPETGTPMERIGYGTLELAAEAVEDLGNDRIVLLRDHGIVAVTGRYHHESPEGFLAAFGKPLVDIAEARACSRNPADPSESPGSVLDVFMKSPDYLSKDPSRFPDGVFKRIIRGKLRKKRKPE